MPGQGASVRLCLHANQLITTDTSDSSPPLASATAVSADAHAVWPALLFLPFHAHAASLILLAPQPDIDTCNLQ